MESPEELLSKGLSDYLHYIWGEIHENGECEDTESGYTACGCHDCEVREILSWVVPRVKRMVQAGQL